MIRIYEVVEKNQAQTQSYSHGFFDTAERVFCYIRNKQNTKRESGNIILNNFTVYERLIEESEIVR